MWYADPTDPAQASGATIASSLKYVAEKKPKVVIMENVAAIADAARRGIAWDELRHIDT